ncbi:cytochrome P450 [Gordonia pseudamarae]|uniref:Cytochrome P450 n=1 Tax=Gordonia pseudamarae TaxID=2831662 RepID=A0ABX6IHP7_9ACTN|nr:MULTISPECIES: cytochrome P450 [Gordonia]MBD0020414.1 cytochrome P450 [Gordonia sp. (in: high G+C Gram-positive bacteria)]QHN25729.1 cytochrome P450 [Gordonia pseudamarae]QHN34661.1 cytochrome P450 [Gordonia pseudamarae]
MNWTLRPYPYLYECQRRYGDAFTLRLHALGDVVMLADPRDVESVFRMDPDHGRTGEANALMTPIVGADSLFVLDGEQHRRRRAEMRSSLTTRPRIDPQAVARLTREELPEDGGVVEVTELFRWLAMRLIGYRVLGTDDPDLLRVFFARLHGVTGSLSSLAAFFPVLQRERGVASPGYWFQRRIAALDSVLSETVVKAAQEPRTSCVGARMAAARGEAWSDVRGADGFRDDLITLIAAGDDTVASALSWALFWVARTPRVAERIINGDDGVDRGATPEHMAGSGYLEAVCAEALRITPVVDIVSRKTTVPVTIQGFDIPVGSLLSPAIYLVHRRPQVYDTPDVFRPERFLEGKFRPSEYFPFGGGSRRCIGAALAIAEMKTVLGTIVGRYEVRPASIADTSIRYSRRNVTVSPGKFRVQLTPRRP